MHQSSSIEQDININTLRQFCGTTGYYRHGMARSVVLTDGVVYLANHGCGWLIDMLVSHLYFKPKVKREITSQRVGQGYIDLVSTLTVKDTRATFRVKDTDGNTLSMQRIEYTDCPIDVTIYVRSEDNLIVLLLPSED